MNARRGFLARSDSGSGTIAGVALIAVVGVMLAAVASAGNLLVNQTKARAAADLAAVSAAMALRKGSEDPCSTASAVALGNDAELRSCTIDGEDVTVRVARDTLVPFAPEVSRSARAGPTPCD